MVIAENDLRIIKNCRKSLLYHKDEAWKRKGSESCFAHVTMGINNGDEIWERTGIYILTKLSNLAPREGSGLYRDYGLILLLRNTNGQLEKELERMRKNVRNLLREIGFKIEIETNLKTINLKKYRAQKER